MITIRDWCLWWWRRDSNTACLVLIDLAETMTTKDLRQMRDYLDSLARLKEMK
jgi:hypothetical protein